jgi:tRNA-splicing ligase RtcB
VADKVRFIVNKSEDIDKGIVETLERMSDVEGVEKPVVALPDIHYKGSYHTPTGVVVMTDGRIVPKFINPNCGMSFVVTSICSEELNDKRIDAVYNYLRDNISASTRIKPVLSEPELEDIIINGAEWALKKYDLNPGDIENFENKGSLLKNKGYKIEDILKYIPQSCRRMGQVSLNVLGYGNHFIEMQEVQEIYDDEVARLFNIEKGQVCFMLHGDSRAFGRSIADFYSRKARKLLGLQQLYKKTHYKIMANENVPDSVKETVEKINYKINRVKSAIIWKLSGKKTRKRYSFPVIEPGTEEAKAFKLATYAAQNFGYANRTSMTAVIRDGLIRAFEDKRVEVNILYDGNHDCLQEETIDGKTYLAHRNGASRAASKAMLKDHPVFSKTGQPVLLPSSMGNPSFLFFAADGSSDSFYSAPHGAGRLIDRGEAREKFSKNNIISEIEASGMRVYDYGRGNVSEESPTAFKNIDDVAKVVSDSGVAKVVAKMRPLAVLKGWT